MDRWQWKTNVVELLDPVPAILALRLADWAHREWRGCKRGIRGVCQTLGARRWRRHQIQMRLERIIIWRQRQLSNHAHLIAQPNILHRRRANQLILQSIPHQKGSRIGTQITLTCE